MQSRSLTGARIETSDPSCTTLAGQRSLPHGGADRNNPASYNVYDFSGRSLTGARIETLPASRSAPSAMVAPSRGRGSKRPDPAWSFPRRQSLPHGGADRNMHDGEVLALIECRSLTGARIETISARAGLPGGRVAPSRGRGSKREHLDHDLKQRLVAPSRGRGSKRSQRLLTTMFGAVSLPHGGADRNTKHPTMLMTTGASLPHGGADRNLHPVVGRGAGDVAPSRGRGSKLF